MKKLGKELKTRWCSETPIFWKKVKNIMISIGSGALGVIVAERSLSLGIDETVISVCGYVVAACYAMGLSAQLTTTLPDNTQPLQGPQK
jgi:hypothetical protein